MALGFPESGETDSEKRARLYKELYKVGRSCDVYAAVRQDEIRRQLEEMDEVDSWRCSS